MGEVLEPEVAGLGRRFGGAVVDLVGLTVARIVLGVAGVLLFGPGWEERFDAAVLEGALGPVHLWCGYALYYTFFEGRWARTPGKWAFGTAVVCEDGSRPELGRVVVRTLCRFLPVDALSFLVADNGLHDSISRTRVVRTGRSATG
jgi:uncharacterized RDD family membrane protein YckC